MSSGSGSDAIQDMRPEYDSNSNLAHYCSSRTPLVFMGSFWHIAQTWYCCGMCNIWNDLQLNKKLWVSGVSCDLRVTYVPNGYLYCSSPCLIKVARLPFLKGALHEILIYMISKPLNELYFQLHIWMYTYIQKWFWTIVITTVCRTVFEQS